MKFDIFFSICQTPVQGYTPSEKTMFQNFFEQVVLADELGYTTAWVAETHLSCQVQKGNSGAVVPHFEGEIGLNNDILQLAHLVFSKSKQIHIGSAIRNILCNGGPIAHAEAIRTFMTLHELHDNASRRLRIGFASGRFPFSNIPYGIKPRDELEKILWPILRGRIFAQATEIFLRLLKGEHLGSSMIEDRGEVKATDFRDPQDWKKVEEHLGKSVDKVHIPSFYDFEPVGVIPFEAPMERLDLLLGSSDRTVIKLANQFLPVAAFNLSITPPPMLEKMHEMMREVYHADGGPWLREYMPRTVLCFVNDDEGASLEQKRERANHKAQMANENYWKAIEGTLDPAKVANATKNALVGTAEDVVEQIQERFHPKDRLMLWFDFNNHDNEDVMKQMRIFSEKVIPEVSHD